MVKSLPQYKNKHWKDSELSIEDETENNSEDVKIVQKHYVQPKRDLEARIVMKILCSLKMNIKIG